MPVDTPLGTLATGQEMDYALRKMDTTTTIEPDHPSTEPVKRS